MFFAGVVSTVLIFPTLSDRFYGRRPIILVVIGISIIAQAGLILTTNIYVAYTFMFILGACMPGRVFVALTNILEFVSEAYKYRVTFLYLGSEPVVLTFMTLWYQFIDKGWFTL